MNVTLIRSNSNGECCRVTELSALLDKMKVETKEMLITSLRYSLQFKNSSAVKMQTKKIPKICFATSCKRWGMK